MTDEISDRGDALPTPEPAPGVNPAPQDPAPQDPAPEPSPEEKNGGESPRDDKGRFIPKSRFDEAVTRERIAREAAERELAELKAQLKQVDRNADVDKIEAEIVELEKARDKALLDADTEKSAALAAQIRMKVETVNIARQENVPERIKEEMREELRWESTVKSLEDAYAELKPGGEIYDQDIVDMVLVTQRELQRAQRMAPSAALMAAAEKVMGKIKTITERASKNSGLDAGKVALDDRTKAQVQKNLDTMKKQPPDMNDAGLDSDKAGQVRDIDVTKLTGEEFANLPESTKARLRGDLL